MVRWRRQPCAVVQRIYHLIFENSCSPLSGECYGHIRFHFCFNNTIAYYVCSSVGIKIPMTANFMKILQKCKYLDIGWETGKLLLRLMIWCILTVLISVTIGLRFLFFSILGLVKNENRFQYHLLVTMPT